MRIRHVLLLMLFCAAFGVLIALAIALSGRASEWCALGSVFALAYAGAALKDILEAMKDEEQDKYAILVEANTLSKVILLSDALDKAIAEERFEDAQRIQNLLDRAEEVEASDAGPTTISLHL